MKATLIGLGFGIYVWNLKSQCFMWRLVHNRIHVASLLIARGMQIDLGCGSRTKHNPSPLQARNIGLYAN